MQHVPALEAPSRRELPPGLRLLAARRALRRRGPRDASDLHGASKGQVRGAPGPVGRITKAAPARPGWAPGCEAAPRPAGAPQLSRSHSAEQPGTRGPPGTGLGADLAPGGSTGPGRGCESPGGRGGPGGAGWEPPGAPALLPLGEAWTRLGRAAGTCRPHTRGADTPHRSAPGVALRGRRGPAAPSRGSLRSRAGGSAPAGTHAGPGLAGPTRRGGSGDREGFPPPALAAPSPGERSFCRRGRAKRPPASRGAERIRRGRHFAGNFSLSPYFLPAPRTSGAAPGPASQAAPGQSRRAGR